MLKGKKMNGESIPKLRREWAGDPVAGMKTNVPCVFVLQIETFGPRSQRDGFVWAAFAQGLNHSMGRPPHGSHSALPSRPSAAAKNLKGWVHGFHIFG